VRTFRNVDSGETKKKNAGIINVSVRPRYQVRRYHLARLYAKHKLARLNRACLTARLTIEGRKNVVT